MKERHTINGQIFTNARNRFTVQHKGNVMYTFLRRKYCMKQGKIMCDAWLEYQNFIQWYEEYILDKPVFLQYNEERDIVDKDFITIIDMRDKPYQYARKTWYRHANEEPKFLDYVERRKSNNEPIC
ncbi:MAG: hypothetical protein RR585_10935 [Coprobacillus sp.]